VISKSERTHYLIFIDESGTSDIKSYKNQPFFTLVGLVISSENRKKLNTDFQDLKQKHFGAKGYVIHNTEIVRHLKTPKKVQDFAVDLGKFLQKHQFFVLYTNTNKEKAFRLGWVKVTTLNRSYRILLSNLLKFLIAKNLRGNIVSEASNPEQDIIIYKSMFHLLVNGIERLKILPKQAKQHMTSLSFVTKQNNDAEEQIADLFGPCPRIIKNIENKVMVEGDLNPIQKVLLHSFKSKLFVGRAKKKNKLKLYKEINSGVELP